MILTTQQTGRQTRETVVAKATTDDNGHYGGELEPGTYIVRVSVFQKSVEDQRVEIECGCTATANFEVPVGVQCTPLVDDTECAGGISEGQVVCLRADPDDPANLNYAWSVSGGTLIEQRNRQNVRMVHWDTTGLRGVYAATLTVSEKGSASIRAGASATVTPRPVARIGTVPVTLQRTAIQPSSDQALWVVIRNRTDAISFSRYKEFIDAVMCCTRDVPPREKLKNRDFEQRLPFPGVDAYNLLKVATEFFLMQECGLAIENDVLFDAEAESRRLGRTVTLDEVRRLRDDYLEQLVGENVGITALPYLKLIREKLSEVPLKSPEVTPPNCYGILRSKVTDPCLLELIWSYWHEEGMLVQTLNAISLRFQNRRGAADRDPLARLDIDPLRPLNNLIWGYIQDEQHRLTVARRVYEYDHHYGLRLYGKAVPEIRSVDSRSKFLEGFHNLLHLCTVFFQQDDDTTVIADGFPVLNGLREVHLLLAEGAHNQFGDLPSNARQEMLIQQWLLARPEMREFLGGRIMVPYVEPWMDRVDTMKTLQGWTDTTITHFRDLGVYGEQILLSIRYGNWNVVNDPVQAANWARYWRPEIQRYIHAYRAGTGVDLTNPDTVDATMPSVHLRKRLAMQSSKR
jgi:hypothetical protein